MNLIQRWKESDFLCEALNCRVASVDADDFEDFLSPFGWDSPAFDILFWLCHKNMLRDFSKEAYLSVQVFLISAVKGNSTSGALLREGKILYRDKNKEWVLIRKTEGIITYEPI